MGGLEDLINACAVCNQHASSCPQKHLQGPDSPSPLLFAAFSGPLRTSNTATPLTSLKALTIYVTTLNKDYTSDDASPVTDYLTT